MKPTSENKNAQAISSQLNLETAQVDWSELERFFAAGMLVHIDASLDLIDVAVEISQDNKSFVEKHMNAGTVKPVEDSQAIQWQQNQTRLWAVVIKPWVFVQEK
ncbi:MAG: DUF2288 domain-containing protein [Cellvibrionaceae bacterium]